MSRDVLGITRFRRSAAYHRPWRTEPHLAQGSAARGVTARGNLAMLPDVTTPEPDTRAELDYLRKLNLALLTLLEKKGVLSDTEVQMVLRTAHRAAYPPKPAAPVGPALLGTRWVKPEGSGGSGQD